MSVETSRLPSANRLTAEEATILPKPMTYAVVIADVPLKLFARANRIFKLAGSSKLPDVWERRVYHFFWNDDAWMIYRGDPADVLIFKGYIITLTSWHDVLRWWHRLSARNLVYLWE